MSKNPLLVQNLPYRMIALLVPALITALFIITLAVSLPQSLFVPMLGLITAYLLPPAGKETVIPVGIALGIPWWYMALSVVMVDTIFGLFMALNFDLSYRIPYIGPLLEDITRKTQLFIVDHPWFASLWFFAIVLMVMVPFFGSGGVRGSVAGKILGLSTTLTFLAILAGSLIGCFGIALGSDVILTWLCASGTVPEWISAGVCVT
jgi:Putative small multi-drug export protein